MPGSGRMNTFAEFRYSSEALMEKGHSARSPFPLPRFDDGGGADGQQADHGTDLEPLRTAIGKAQDVIVKPVLFVPHAIRPYLIHGPGDPDEMFGELRYQIHVARIVSGQFDADLQHVLA